ncbi:MAG: hypothetical protein LBT33_02700 [Spirochaetia bacterium]|nr:hypothetical protein [Spirochaetia bacterium]
MTEVSRLARILYYTGVTLKKIGAHDEAARFWSVSRKVCKTTPALHCMRWFCNEYGMARQDFIDTDDWRAFYLIQLRRYLHMKESHCLQTQAEADMIRDLVYEAWAVLKTSVCLEEMSLEEKLLVFHEAGIIFPLFHPAEGPPGGSRHPAPGMKLRHADKF